MHFDSPKLLALIPLAFVLLGLLYLWTLRRKRQRLERLGNRQTIMKLIRGVSRVRQHLKYFFFATAILFILFSLSRPQYGAQERPLQRRGVEVLIAVDCSTSMLGQDIRPNRLTRAREQLRDLIMMLEGDNIGIIAFAGIPIVQCPMTSDYKMALNLFETLAVDSMPVQGTDLGAAIRKALDTFKSPGKGKKVLVLLTDGEAHDEKTLEAAEKAAEAGVIIHAIGIGSTEGVPIPMPGGGYKESGNIKINTRLDFKTLRDIAFATGGKAIKANEKGDLELAAIYRDISALKENDLDSSAVIVRTERFQIFLGFAILLLACEMLIGERRRGGAGAGEGVGRFD